MSPLRTLKKPAKVSEMVHHMVHDSEALYFCVLNVAVLRDWAALKDLKRMVKDGKKWARCLAPRKEVYKSPTSRVCRYQYWHAPPGNPTATARVRLS
jgi:hypothetical protein